MENKWKLWSKVQFENSKIFVAEHSHLKLKNLYSKRALQAESDLISLLDEMQRELGWLESLEPTSIGMEKTTQDRITKLTNILNQYR